MTQRGSAPVETVLSIMFLMLLVIGTIEVALALYGRDVVAAAAHEGARAALEFGGSPSSASEVATRMVRASSGGLVRDLKVVVVPRRIAGTVYVQVRIRGWLRLMGPIPVPFPVAATATVSRQVAPQ